MSCVWLKRNHTEAANPLTAFNQRLKDFSTVVELKDKRRNLSRTKSSCCKGALEMLCYVLMSNRLNIQIYKHIYFKLGRTKVFRKLLPGNGLTLCFHLVFFKKRAHLKRRLNRNGHCEIMKVNLNLNTWPSGISFKGFFTCNRNICRRL